MDYNQKLNQLREKIDQVDDEIYSSILRRSLLTSSIGELKKEHGITEMCENRRREIYNKLKDRCIEDGLPVSLIESVYDVLFDQSMLEQTLIIYDR